MSKFAVFTHSDWKSERVLKPVYSIFLSCLKLAMFYVIRDSSHLAQTAKIGIFWQVLVNFRVVFCANFLNIG